MATKVSKLCNFKDYSPFNSLNISYLTAVYLKHSYATFCIVEQNLKV
jgi:hypothetical protein